MKKLKICAVISVLTAVLLLLSGCSGCAGDSDKSVTAGKVTFTVPAGFRECDEKERTASFSEALYSTDSGRCYVRVFVEFGDYSGAQGYINYVKELYGYNGQITTVSGDLYTAYLEYTVDGKPSLRGYLAARMIGNECWFVDYMENTDVPSDVEYFPMFKEWAHEFTESK